MKDLVCSVEVAGNKKAPEVVSGASLVVRCEDGF